MFPLILFSKRAQNLINWNSYSCSQSLHNFKSRVFKRIIECLGLIVGSSSIWPSSIKLPITLDLQKTIIHPSTLAMCIKLSQHCSYQINLGDSRNSVVEGKGYLEPEVPDTAAHTLLKAEARGF